MADAMQIYQTYNTAMTAFDAASGNVADRMAAQLATRLGSDSGDLIAASSVSDASEIWYDFVTAYTQLIERCGQLVQA
jgi:hypothetical protein